MYVLMSGEPPFKGVDAKEVFKNITRIKYDFDSPIWRNISSEAQDLISKIFIRHPAKRITI